MMRWWWSLSDWSHRLAREQSCTMLNILHRSILSKWTKKANFKVKLPKMISLRLFYRQNAMLVVREYPKTTRFVLLHTFYPNFWIFLHRYLLYLWHFATLHENLGNPIFFKILFLTNHISHHIGFKLDIIGYYFSPTIFQTIFLSYFSQYFAQNIFMRRHIYGDILCFTFRRVWFLAFLTSPDAQEVIMVSQWVSQSVSESVSPS